MPESLYRKLQSRWRDAGNLRKDMLAWNGNRAFPIIISFDKKVPAWFSALSLITLIINPWSLIKWAVPPVANLIAFVVAATYFVFIAPITVIAHSLEVLGVNKMMSKIGGVWNSFLNYIGWGDASVSSIVEPRPTYDRRLSPYNNQPHSQGIRLSTHTGENSNVNDAQSPNSSLPRSRLRNFCW